ncbi:hypothetical protein AOQ84DRAFT_410315, partial [Glonium stellatum]
SLSLQQQAIRKARAAYARFPNGDALFQQCIAQQDTVGEIMKSIKQKYDSNQEEKLNRILNKFQDYTAWLRNISGVVDIVVQTQAGIGCPLWAPIKFVLQISDFHAGVAAKILEMIELMLESSPRFEIYEKLNEEPVLQTALLDMFTNVVELSMKIYQHFKHGSLKQGARENQNLRQRCEAWLKSSNTKAIHQFQLQKKTPGTCDWIWSNSTFLQWSNMPEDSAAAERLFCIYGKHGCGKTVLASSVVEVLRGQGRRVLFFSFSGTDASRQTLDGLVRSFLWQLLQETTSTESLDIVRDVMFHGQPATSDLWDAFNRVATLISGPIYWIIDGVDECREPSQKVFDHILTLLSAHDTTRAILLGRPNIIGSDGPTNFSIDISPSIIQSDIDTFISSQIHDSILLQSPELRDRVHATLQEKSNGMFLWVKLMADDLNKSSSHAELMDRLRDLPRDLEQGYSHLITQLLKKLDKFELRLARSILSLTTVASRTLKLEELRYALALDARSRSDEPNKRPLKDYLLVKPAQKIRHVCGGLVNVYTEDTDDFVSLIHFSAKEFLTRPESEWESEDDRKIKKLQIVSSESHGLFITACLEYAGMGERGSAALITEPLNSIWAQCPFLEYASRYSIHHLNRSELSTASLAKTIQRFIESKASGSLVEFYYVHFLEDGPTGPEMEDLESISSRLAEEEHDFETLLKFAQTHMDEELFCRKQQFGENDSRTERWIMVGDIATAKVSIESRLKSEALNAACTLNSQSSYSKFSEIIDILQNSGTLPMQKQIDLLLTLRSQLQRLKVLADPLEILFRLVLQYAPTIPALALCTIGKFYRSLGKHEKSLAFFEAAFKRYGNRNVPAKFFTRDNVGCVLQVLGRNEEAEQAFRDAAEGLMQTLGPDHLDTIDVLESLGVSLLQQDKWEEVEEKFRKVVNVRDVKLGRYHQDTLRVLNNLAIVLRKLKKYEEEEKTLRELAERREQMDGPEDTGTIDVIAALAYTLCNRGKWEEAEKEYRKAVKVRETRLGRYDEKTLCVVEALGSTLYNQSKLAEAAELYDWTVGGYQTESERINEDTIRAKMNQQSALAQQGEAAEAEEEIRKVLEIAEKMFGQAHPLTLYGRYKLGRSLILQQRHVEAKIIFRKVTEEWEKDPALKLKAMPGNVRYLEEYLASGEQHATGEVAEGSNAT